MPADEVGLLGDLAIYRQGRTRFHKISKVLYATLQYRVLASILKQMSPHAEAWPSP